MFDLTKKIKLEPSLYKKYVIARIFLYLVFLAGAFFVMYRILFPSLQLDFSFSNISSLKNTLGSPRTSQMILPEKGFVPAQEKLTFDANPVGNFSEATVTFTMEKISENIEKTPVNFRKSYQAFFYPEGNPAGFKNGTLLLATDGGYYIVSDGTLRKFSNSNILLKMGYTKNSFMIVDPKDLQYNNVGKEISDENDYPNDTLFLIEDAYYQLKDGQLFPFVSTRAFLSRFDSSQAIPKNADFFVKYPTSETFLGFADGTLASFDQSAFILSKGKSYPIINAETFIQMGFDWNDIVALDPEELGLYERQKSFTQSQPHPDGTLFLDRKTNKYYVIENRQKHPIESLAIEKNYLKQKPVIAGLEESEKVFSCNLKKGLFNSKKYSCTVSVDELNSFLGNDYLIYTTFLAETKIDYINVTFFTQFTWQNFKLSLSDIKGRIQNNYMQQPQ